MASLKRTILRGMEKKSITKAADGVNNRRMRRAKHKKDTK